MEVILMPRTILFTALLLALLASACGGRPAAQAPAAAEPAATFTAVVIPTTAAIAVDTPAAPTAAPSPQPSPTAEENTLNLTSPAFANGEAIPQKYTCEGEDISPELRWGDPPEGTKSFAFIMDDPDAPSGTWVHWIVFNLPPDTRQVQEGASKASGAASILPPGNILGVNSFNRVYYGGPCPPSGQHRYFFRLYALDAMLEPTSVDKATLLQWMEGHILAQGELMGVYQKSK
jgi:Raf kinase inhibitor-like YbhB/YbcL family protein